MMIRELVIVCHPFSVCVPVNYKVTLSVSAEGTGILCYQWFTDNEQEVPGATQAELTFEAQRTQRYVCRVNDRFCECVFSEWVKVKVLDVDKPGAWQGEPHILVHPKLKTVQRGENFNLSCAALGVPLPVYRWYKNGQALDGKSAMTDTLQIDHAAAEHAGSYICSVSNVLEERWTEAADVDIIVIPDRPASTTPTASDKVALLIGNLNYSHHPSLLAPTMDVHTLANLLQQLGFRVVSLLDLTKEEMLAAIDKFVQLLDKGVYGLFYYAGHGYERSGRNYLVPVDAPQPYQPENCVCVQRVMLHMQEKRTALSVVLLDTCRKWYNQDCIPSEIRPLEPSGNTVYGYATCENAEAFEVQDGGKSTGIFTKYLNKHILQSAKITHVLEQVSEDLGRDPLVKGKQVVEIKHTLKESRSLADPVRTAGHTKELCLRDACWRQANELPRKKRLRFPCGVEVEVSFSALFSNVMVAFAIVKAAGPTTQDCSVTLTSIPAMEDIFSGLGRPDEMDSLLYSDNHDSTLTLCGLQKLQGPLVIKVDMHYTHINSKLRLKESQQLDIGKPLVASSKLYKRKPTSIKKGEDAHSMGAISKSPVRQTSCRPITRKAECATRVTTARSNQPEENDESELDFTS